MDPLSSMPPPAPEDGAAEFPNGPITGGGLVAPLEQQLKPDSPLHAKVLKRVKARLDLSHRNRTQRYPDWRRADEKRRLYMNLASPARKGDKTVDNNKVEMPFQRSIVMPVSYAIHETRKTEIVTPFLGRSPFTQLDGRGIEDIKAAKMAEVKLEYDYQESDGPLAVYSLVQDADAYGEGTLYDTWDEQHGWTTTPPDPMQVMIAQELGLPPPEPTEVYGVIKQFTNWQPIDPYSRWPDPRTTAGRLQQAEFQGHRAWRSWHWLNEFSIENGGNHFNLDELKKQGSTGTQGGDTRLSAREGTNSMSQFQLKDSSDENDKGFYAIDNFQIRLVPEEWGLGDSTNAEIWWICMADERLIIRCHKSPYKHEQFTYAVGEVGYDVHQYGNPGIIENLDGLQRTIDWLANSRIENVRKFLNDMLLFAPELIEEDDVMNPGAARWLRTTAQGTLAAMQGLPLDNMIKQFQVQDLTGTHFEIVQFLQDMANKLGAANDNMQGALNDDKRTLGENNNANLAGSKRLMVTARILDAMVFKPLSLRAIQNAQQYTDIEQWVRVAGDYAEIDPENLGRIQMNRSSLTGNFDYVPMSALGNQDPARMLQVWQSLFQTAVETPALSTPDPLDPSVLDIKSLFKMMARLGGAREVDTFFKQMPMMAGPGGAPPGILPDQQIDQGVQSGNLVPLPQAGGAYGGGPQ